MPNSKKRNHRNSRKALLTVPALAITSALLLGVATDRISSTDAAWTDQELAQATFSAASIGTFGAVSCEPVGGILGLATNHLDLAWSPPTGANYFPAGALSYEITWSGTIVIEIGEENSTTTTATEYSFDADSVANVGLPTVITVTPVLSGTDWVGNSQQVMVLRVSLIGLNLIMTC
jgi:hypothetical protein